MAKLDEQTQRILLLLKLDAQHLYQRVQLRAPEYMLIFSTKRTREHFKEIFWYRYQQTTISELKLLSTDLIIALDEFYSSVEEIKWYLYYTEDMPTTVEDWLYHKLGQLEKKYFNLEMYLNAEYDSGSDISNDEVQGFDFSREEDSDIQEEFTGTIELTRLKIEESEEGDDKQDSRNEDEPPGLIDVDDL